MPDSLRGKCIVVTRPAEQAESLCAALRARGAEVVRFPTIRLAPMDDPKPLRRAMSRIDHYDWVLFTSVNGVAYTLDARGAAPWPKDVRVAAIGPATANALQARGITPAHVPPEYVAERLADGLGPVDGMAILLPRAARARPVLAERLRTRGAQVTEVPAYNTLHNRPSRAAYAAVRGRADAITFTSASTVEGFMEAGSTLPAHAVIACIGPITATTAQACGLDVHVVADTYTTDGLVASLERFYAHA